MKISTFKEVVKKIATANKRVAIKVEGEMGIGKSQAVQQVANELGYKYVDLRLAEQEPGDLIGMPYREGNVTYWSKPCWIPDKETKLMLVLEELNRAPIDVQQAIFQLLTEFKIHTHEFPHYTTLVVCVNPSDSIYHVAELDPAMKTRCINLTLEPDVDEWLRYAYENKVDDRIIQFIGTHREMLCNPSDKEPCPLPRTWKLLSDVIQIIPKDALFEVCAGLVGKEAAIVFQKFCDKEYKKPVLGKEILNNYEKVKEKLMRQRNDENFVTVKDLVAVIGDSKLSKEQLANLVNFLLDTAPEWKVRVLNELPEKLLVELSKTKLVDDISSIIMQQNKMKGK